MRFPAGLSARLLRQRASQAFRSEQAPAIFHLSPLVRHSPASVQPEIANPETEWHTPAACVQAANAADAPVIWLGGTEPLFHPAIGEIAAAIAESGRYVFVHTSGAGLRKRIHELRPIARLYLAFEIPLGDAADLAPAQASSVTYETVSEAMRTARLSGFFLCAHFTALRETSAAKIAARVQSFETLGIDGIAFSSGGVSPRPSNDPSSASASRSTAAHSFPRLEILLALARSFLSTIHHHPGGYGPASAQRGNLRGNRLARPPKL